MKIVVTHSSPDMDAITSVWLIRKFLPGWENAIVKFVPAGERIASSKFKVQSSKLEDPIEKIGDDDVIHVDTGLGPLDHHQTVSDNVCGASLTWEYVKKIQNSEFKIQNDKIKSKIEAIDRMVKVVVDIDHFKEVFWPDATSDYHEFSVGSTLDGLKLAKPNQDKYYVDFVSDCLDAILHEFENRIWAEKEIATNGKKFETRFGKGIGFETINDSVIKLAQKMGYVIVVRKDPRKGYVRIKALPNKGRGPATSFPPASAPLTSSKMRAVGSPSSRVTPRAKHVDINLTLAYEKLRKMDPEATWFLHISKKMLLNGSVKNPKMSPTRLGLGEIIRVLEKI